MLEKYDKRIAIGEIVGYSTRLNLLSSKIDVLVKVDGETIKVPIDHRQKKFIQSERQKGSKVAIGFFDGEWHIASTPAASDPYFSDMEVQARELVDMVNGREPVAEPEPAYAMQTANADCASEMDETYILKVEQDFKGEATVMLRRMGLAHLIIMT